jgi:hypothetical protein
MLFCVSTKLKRDIYGLNIDQNDKEDVQSWEGRSNMGLNFVA